MAAEQPPLAAETLAGLLQDVVMPLAPWNLQKGEF